MDIKTEKKRYYLIDAFRAAAIINMVLFHAMWDIVNILKINISWYSGTIGNIWQHFICFSFIIVSGFCFPLGKNHFKRGGIVFAAGLIITAATAIFTPRTRILFGILTFIGSAVIFTAIIENILKRINPLVGSLLCLFLFYISYDITNGHIIFGNIILDLPQSLYTGYFMTYLGFRDPEFYSGDYFPIFPWIFLYFFGYFLNFILMKYDNVKKILEKRISILSFIGKYSLIIYMLHQPIIYAIILIIKK